MLFFQSCLLAGYAWAGKGAYLIGERRHRRFHCVALLAALALFSPIGVGAGYVPPADSNPIASVLLTLTASVGLPILLLSSTSPLLQRWHASANPDAGDRVWRLYAIGNFASLLVLLAYPLVVEPLLTLTEQRWLWSAALAVLAILLIAIARATPAASPPGEQAQGTAIAAGARWWWLLLSAVPSSLLLGATAYLTTDVAAVPFLWILPLALYLLAFALAFAGREPPLLLRRALVPMAILLALVLILVGLTLPLSWTIALHLLVVFAGSWGMLAELYRRRPDKRELGEFYLWIAIGGVLGGLFNSIVAPLCFWSTFEYPIALVLTAALALHWSLPHDGSVRELARPLAIAVLSALLIVALRAFGIVDPTLRVALLALPMLLCFSSRGTPAVFGLSVAAMVGGIGLAARADAHLFLVERSFFGVHRVTEPVDGELRQLRQYIELQHGTTTHGRQRFDYVRQVPLAPEEPLSYYHRRGPLGGIFARFEGSTGKRAAIIGMGAASIAAYSSPQLSATYFEIDPTVIRIAAESPYFSFIRAARERGAHIEIVPGDARLTLSRYAGEPFDLLVMDAFSGDAIPIHLLTIEAFRGYLGHLTEHALIALHISNRYLDLRPVCARLAQEIGFGAVYRFDREPADAASGKSPSIWVAMARDHDVLQQLTADAGEWSRLSASPDDRLWTDDYSNLVGVLRWR